MKNLNIYKKALSGLLAMALTTGLAVSNISDANAEKKTKKTKVTYTEEEESYYGEITYLAANYVSTRKTSKSEYGKFSNNIIMIGDVPFGEYVVKEGDTISRISEKVCSHEKIEISTEYWPFLAIINHYPRVINQGDVIIYPSEPEMLKALYLYNRVKGNNSKYIINNDIYKSSKKKGTISRKALSELINEIYEGKVCVDEDTLLKYLKLTELDKKYDLADTNGFVGDQDFEVTDYIPDLSEFDNNRSVVETNDSYLIFYRDALNNPCLQVINKTAEENHKTRNYA